MSVYRFYVTVGTVYLVDIEADSYLESAEAADKLTAEDMKEDWNKGTTDPHVVFKEVAGVSPDFYASDLLARE